MFLVRDTQWSQSEVPDISYVWTCKSRGCCERNAWCSGQVCYSCQTDAFSWNGWAQCEQIYNAQDKPGLDRERLSTIGQVPTQLPNSHMSQQFWERYGSVLVQCWGIIPKPLLLLQEEFMQMKRPLWNWSITWSWRADSAMSWSESMVVTCSNIAVLSHNQVCS